LLKKLETIRNIALIRHKEESSLELVVVGGLLRRQKVDLGTNKFNVIIFSGRKYMELCEGEKGSMYSI